MKRNLARWYGGDKMGDIPFEKTVDNIFQSDSGIVKKMLVGAFVGLSVGVGVIWKINSGNPPEEQIGVGGKILGTVVIMVIVTGLVALLCLFDIARKRTSNRQLAKQILAELKEVGVTVKLQDGKVRFSPQSAVTPELLDRMKEHKNDLITVLENPICRRSGLAIASLILSCSSLCLGPLGFTPGIVCGHLARSKCRNNPSVAGDGLAFAGLIVCYIFAVIFVIYLVVLFILAM